MAAPGNVKKAVRAGVVVPLVPALRVDYVGDPVQNKNKTSKPATLFLCRCGSKQAEQTS